MRKAWSTIFLICVLSTGFSQTGSILWNSGSFSLGVQANGALFQKDGMPASFVNQDNSHHFLAGSFPWIYAESGSNIFGAMGTDTASEWWPGPIDTFLLTAKNPEDWANVWAVNKSEVLNHRTNFAKDGYVTPPSIANWPANIQEQGVPNIMAPFVDFDENGVYEPDSGDYPFLLGDWNAYTIFNDAHGEHPTSGAQKAGIEMRCMLFTFKNDNLKNVVFARWYIINRSEETYDRIHFGQMIPVELGNPNDNYVRTNVDKNAVFSYNGDDLDEGGFEENLPSMFFSFLNRDISSSCLFIENDDVRRLPANSSEFAEVMKGSWPDGSPKYLEGNGKAGVNVTKFVYPGTTGENTSVNSTEENASDQPGKRAFLAVVEIPRQLAPGDFFTVDAAYGFTLNVDIGLSRIESLLNNTIAYHRNALTVRKPKPSNKLNIYPNPVKSGEKSTFGKHISEVRVYTIAGQKIFSAKRLPGEVNMTRVISLPPGIYVLENLSNGVVNTTRLVVH